MSQINLVSESGIVEPYTLQASKDFVIEKGIVLPRITYSAVHVVANPLANVDPWINAAVDWDATINYRRYLWSMGLGVAEAMDTAQRGMGLDWEGAKELIRQSLNAAKDFPSAIVASGCGTDHLDVSEGLELDDVIRAYEEQMEFIEGEGGKIILMASRALATCAKSPDDYAKVYDRILSQVKEPVIMHWLGDMFDPALRGYWGKAALNDAMDVCLGIIEQNADKIDGIKISLLDKDKEIDMRRRLPASVKMYTGDDFNYAELIQGDDQGYSHALLGIFDAIAPAACAALQALGKGDTELFNNILKPTVPLSRHIFKAPTRFYKTGVVFMAYLNGHQNHFTMIGGQQSTRSLPHLCTLFKLADNAGIFADQDQAVARMKAVLKFHGVEG
jgi:hypothetical protein